MGCTPLIVERLHSSYSYIRDKGPVSKLSLVERLHCIRDKRTCLQIELYMYMEPLSRQCMDPPFKLKGCMDRASLQRPSWCVCSAWSLSTRDKLGVYAVHGTSLQGTRDKLGEYAVHGASLRGTSLSLWYGWCMLPSKDKLACICSAWASLQGRCMP